MEILPWHGLDFALSSCHLALIPMDFRGTGDRIILEENAVGFTSFPWCFQDFRSRISLLVCCSIIIFDQNSWLFPRLNKGHTHHQFLYPHFHGYLHCSPVCLLICSRIPRYSLVIKHGHGQFPGFLDDVLFIDRNSRGFPSYVWSPGGWTQQKKCEWLNHPKALKPLWFLVRSSQESPKINKKSQLYDSTAIIYKLPCKTDSSLAFPPVGMWTFPVSEFMGFFCQQWIDCWNCTYITSNNSDKSLRYFNLSIISHSCLSSNLLISEIVNSLSHYK